MTAKKDPGIPRFSAKKTTQMFNRLRAGDEKAREEIIEHHILLVKSIAGYFSRKTALDFEDLESEGYLGLLVAVEKFDPRKALAGGTRFSSYAYWWIRRYILRMMVNNNLLVSVPENVAELHYKYRQCFTRLARMNGHEPSSREVLKKLALTLRQEQQILRRDCLKEYSLDQPQGEKGEKGDHFAGLAPERKTDDFGLSLQRRELVEKLMSRLSPVEKKVVSMRFGLDKSWPMTYREIAERLAERDGLRLSRQRVHQVGKRAMHKLQQLAGDNPARGPAACSGQQSGAMMKAEP